MDTTRSGIWGIKTFWSPSPLPLTATAWWKKPSPSSALTAAASPCYAPELGDSLEYASRRQPFDLLICGNHRDGMMNKVSCSAARFINISHIDVLIVPL